MRPFLRAAWLTSPAGTDGPGLQAIGSYVAGLAGTGVGASAAYALVQGGPTMQSVKHRLDDMDLDTYPSMPDVVVLSECDTLDAAVDLEAAAGELLGRLEAAALSAVVSGIYREISFTPGREAAPASGFGPAIQFGTFNMRAPTDEWAVTDWYRTRRLPSFSTITGGIRARRLVSVCAGPAKLGILYEFTSLDARLEHFEPLEAVDHDEARPTAATKTVHPPMSPGIGAALPVPG